MTKLLHRETGKNWA